jgi:TrpR-related protein YerC/YecD
MNRFTPKSELDLDFLFDAVLCLKTREECGRFFDDLCTMPELKAISQRLHVAYMLNKNSVYSEIVSKTGASTATISRVNRSLSYGSDGYQTVFERLEASGGITPVFGHNGHKASAAEDATGASGEGRKDEAGSDGA